MNELICIWEIIQELDSIARYLFPYYMFGDEYRCFSQGYDLEIFVIIDNEVYFS